MWGIPISTLVVSGVAITAVIVIVELVKQLNEKNRNFNEAAQALKVNIAHDTALSVTNLMDAIFNELKSKTDLFELGKLRERWEKFQNKLDCLEESSRVATDLIIFLKENDQCGKETAKLEICEELLRKSQKLINNKIEEMHQLIWLALSEERLRLEWEQLLKS
jgi:hypothetical protein